MVIHDYIFWPFFLTTHPNPSTFPFICVFMYTDPHLHSHHLPVTAAVVAALPLPVVLDAEDLAGWIAAVEQPDMCAVFVHVKR